jgi:primosomal protein N'
MVKVKTFIFSTMKLGVYNGHFDVAWDSDCIDSIVNEFLQGKELIAINTESIARGNNPPCYALVYTITYKEA